MKGLFAKKAQVALEFLTTYSWMLMMIVIAGAALYSLGVFKTDDYLPGQCTVGYDFSCDKHVIKSNGTVRVELTNYLGEEVIIKNFTCKYQDNPEQASTASQLPANLNWLMGDSKVFECNVGVPLPAESREEVQISLKYVKAAGGFDKTTTGVVIDNVVE